MKYYCPACGEYSEGEVIDILPGNNYWTCPECGVKHRIQIEFFEVASSLKD